MSAMVAAIQLCSTDTVADNLKTASALIEKAKIAGARLIVLPEMFACLRHHTERFGEGPLQDFLSRMARTQQVWLVGGTIPIVAESGNKIRAACLVYDANGKNVARYDKMHLFDAHISATERYQESASVEPGDRTLVIDTPIGKLGLAVCFDIRFSAVFSELFKKGAEIIAIPAAFTVKTGRAHWRLLARSRAVENFCYVIGACQGGRHASGRQTYGHSLIVDPWGKVQSELNRSEIGIALGTIDLNYLREIRTSLGAQL